MRPNKTRIVPPVLFVLCMLPGSCARSAAHPPTDQNAAKASAAQFLCDLGVPAAQTSPWVTESKTLNRWDVKAGDYTVQVDVTTGKPVFFRNDKRIEDLVYRRGRTGKRRFARRADAKKFARELAAKAGVPATWKLTRFENASPRGEIVANFSEPISGRYPMLGHPGIAAPYGLNWALLQLDVQDGAPKYFTIQRDIIQDPPKLRVDRQQAIGLARQAYSAYYRGRRSHHGGPMNPSGIQLGYAVPIGSYTPGKPIHARLVWSVPFGSEPVRVDADTGKTEVVALK